MALLREPLKVSMRQTNKEHQWQDPIDDLFESFINPDSFRLTNTEVESHDDDLTNFFDVQPSSSGSDTIDTSPIPDLDTGRTLQVIPWHNAALPFERNAASPGHEHTLLSYAALHNRPVIADSQILSLKTSTQISSPLLQPSSPRNTSGWSTKNTKLFETPLAIRKRVRGSPSKVEKSASRGSVSPKMMGSSNYKQASQTLWTRQLPPGSAADQLNLKDPFAQQRPESPPNYELFKSGNIAYSYGDDIPLRSPSTIQDEVEPLSPLSNGYTLFQPPKTPVASPRFDSRLTSPRSSFNEPHPHQLSYSSTDNAGFMMTPPSTQPMISSSWPDDSSLPVQSPDLSHANKAEAWWGLTSQPTADPSEVTCGAPASLNMLGLGISGVNNANQVSMANNGTGHVQPSIITLGTNQLVTSPTPSNIQSRRPPFSASASPDGVSRFPISPLQQNQQHTHAQAQTMRSQHMQQSAFYRPHHQRHHTIGTPISTIQSSATTIPQPDQIDEDAGSFSASPPPQCRPQVLSHRRSKSSHHNRRKSGVISKGGSNSARPASVGFVNFTPDDSRKILTGVAPSGSSKTKARREKEAAEKRRKFSEAAKKAVLDAGGDLEMLEREGLLVLGSDL